MGALDAAIIVLILVLLYHCCNKENMWGMDTRPYTPAIKGPAWASETPVVMFESAATPSRAGTLLHRLGMESAAGPKESFQSGGIGSGTVWGRAMNF